jgi:hypothetical protein
MDILRATSADSTQRRTHTSDSETQAKAMVNRSLNMATLHVSAPRDIRRGMQTAGRDEDHGRSERGVRGSAFRCEIRFVLCNVPLKLTSLPAGSAAIRARCCSCRSGGGEKERGYVVSPRGASGASRVFNGPTRAPPTAVVLHAPRRPGRCASLMKGCTEAADLVEMSLARGSSPGYGFNKRLGHHRKSPESVSYLG